MSPPTKAKSEGVVCDRHAGIRQDPPRLYPDAEARYRWVYTLVYLGTPPPLPHPATWCVLYDTCSSRRIQAHPQVPSRNQLSLIIWPNLFCKQFQEALNTPRQLRFRIKYASNNNVHTTTTPTITRVSRDFLRRIALSRPFTTGNFVPTDIILLPMLSNIVRWSRSELPTWVACASTSSRALVPAAMLFLSRIKALAFDWTVTPIKGVVSLAPAISSALSFACTNTPVELMMG